MGLFLFIADQFVKKTLLHLECVKVVKTLHQIDQSLRFSELREKASIVGLSLIEKQEYALIYERARIRHMVDM